jgi:hypothetical protein
VLDDLLSPIFSTLENLLQDGKKPDVEDLTRLIQTSIEKLSSVVMFIDGLDEMSESDRKLVFSHLRIVTDLGSTSCVKAFVSSREDATYLIKLPNVPNFKIQVSSNTIAGDIDKYVKDEIRVFGTRAI